MSKKMRAALVPYSSVVGQSISITGHDGRVIAQLSVMTPAGPPPGEDHKAFAGRIAKLVVDKINA